MAKRQKILKSLRYDIFTRDGYTCQYCGRKPPDVILHIDHRIPVAEGGENDEMNLLTACEACNSGKSAKLPGEFTPTPDAEARRLRLNQESAEYQLFLEAAQDRDYWQEKVIERLRREWMIASGVESYPQDKTMRSWLCRFEPEIIMKAIQCATPGFNSGKLSVATNRDADSAIRYVSGIMHNMATEGEA